MGKKPGDGTIKFTDADFQKIETLAGYGLKTADIAAMFNRSEGGFRRYFKRYPEIKDAIRAGRAKANSNVIQALYKKAKDGDIKAMEFWLRNRLHEDWNHDRRLDISHAGEVNVNIVDKRVDKLASLLDRTRDVIEVQTNELHIGSAEAESADDNRDCIDEALHPKREDETVG